MFNASYLNNRDFFAQIEESKKMIFFDPKTNPPKERTRYLAYDETGWCIGDCFYGRANYDYWSNDLQSRVLRVGCEKECWRYSESENIVQFDVAFYAELPKIEP